MDFSRLTEYLDYLHKLNVPGCDLAVYRDHELIYRHQAGCRDLDRTEPMQGDEVFFLYSATKVFTTCAAMQLIEQGKMNLDDPVSTYLPAYAHLTVKDGDSVRPAKTVMTVRHLMSMQSGLNYNTEIPAIETVMTGVPMADAICPVAKFMMVLNVPDATPTLSPLMSAAATSRMLSAVPK